MAHFTQVQLKELEVFFGLKPAVGTLPVRDGHVCKTDLVWWRGDAGPEQTLAGVESHWDNIKNYPNTYQLTKPRVSVTYKD